MVYTAYEAKFEAFWDRLNGQFSDQDDIIGYLEEQWMGRKEECAGPWIYRNVNFGRRTISPTGSSHGELEGKLLHGRSNLYRLSGVFIELVDLKKAKFEHTVTEEKLRQRQQFLGRGYNWLGNTTKEIFRKAIGKINGRKRLLDSLLSNRLYSQGRSLQPCTGAFERQWGMPCAYRLEAKLADNELSRRRTLPDSSAQRTSQGDDSEGPV